MLSEKVSLQLSTFRAQKLLFCSAALIPIFFAFIVLRGYPIANTFVLSFRRWNLLSAAKPWVGFRNYAKLLSSPEFTGAFLNTTIITFLFVPAVMAISLLLALLINSRRIKPFVPIYQFIYFLPVVCSIVPSAVVWRWMLDTQYGLLNYFLSWFRVPARAWLIDSPLVLYSIVMFDVWKNAGYYLIIFYVGLKGIPDQYYEAARIDGANNWQILTRITAPLLKPIILFVAVIATIRTYNIFTEAYVLVSSGGQMCPSARVLVYEIYEEAFQFYRMGYASAEVVALLMVVALFTVFLFTAAREKRGRTV